MKVIFGLGNPGKEYENTRHNIGFGIADKLKAKLNFPEFEKSNKFKAEISKAAEIILVKPLAFMNLSGEVTRNVLDFYKLTADDIVVIHDDLDIAVGKYKIATDSSSAGHNGVQNIIDTLGTQKFKRVRIGIGEEKGDAIVCRLDAHDFVLDKFSEEEQKKIADIEPAIIEEIKKLSV
jgi:PTH1 family peptidyl-tRNA hydrolase